MRTGMDDYKDLVDRVQRMENAAMDKLVEMFSAPMERIAHKLIGKAIQSQLDAADAVQTVQLALWIGIRTGRFVLPTPNHFLRLTKTLLRRHIARYWRKARNGLTLQLHSDSQLNSCTNLPAQAVDTNEFLEKFLHQIKDTDRQLLTMRFTGYTTAEAAKHMKRGPGSLRMRLRRLRGKFARFRRACA